ncbi:glutathione S-transferase [Stigmatella aurantiaca]|uniref:glutathione transferase n=1 Tax=Stigmatella aurantiaca TaxID=41 RepID=A0A1H7XC99_STIAU|nr:glutathione S-transferase [Stigmatella aurantiaca]SEM30797.1 glutathione S-transferase [Stigmatella aurantiaca]
MLKLHHLVNSRSQRILWLLEELGLDYELAVYPRDPKTNFAPPELKAIHPLGKSPVLEDGGRVLAESGAIIDSVVRRHGQGRLAPPLDSAEYDTYVHWMHYAEGSAMVPILLGVYVGRLGEAGAPLQPRISGELRNHLGYISGALEGRDYLVGNTFSAADIQMSFVLEAARASGALEAFPNLGAYLDRLHARPAYQRAIQRGGPVNLGGQGRR